MSDTDVFQEEDTDWLTLIDFDADIPCSILNQDCLNPAEWRLVKICGCSKVLCTKHKDEVVEALVDMPSFELAKCLMCGSVIAGNPLKEVIPI